MSPAMADERPAPGLNFLVDPYQPECYDDAKCLLITLRDYLSKLPPAESLFLPISVIDKFLKLHRFSSYTEWDDEE